MEFKADRVPRFECQACHAPIESGAASPLSSMRCPTCGQKTIVPALLDDLLLTKVIGVGASGIVCQALDQTLHRLVAVKILRLSKGDDYQRLQNCLMEARALASLNSRNVVQIHRIGEYKDQPYIVMELLTGGRLDTVLSDGQRFEEDRALIIATEAAAGLRAAAMAGLLHLDIKPANILLDAEGVAKLIDFGGAQFDTHVETERLVATPYYMAPEIALRKATDLRTDIYSLGATLFRLLVGRPPFEGANTKEVVTARIRQPAPDLCDIDPEMHPRIAEVVAKMLERDPDDRQQTYDELIDDLADARYALAHEPVPVIQAAPAAPSRSRATARKKKSSPLPMLIGGFVLMLAIGGGLIYVMNQGQDPAPQPPVAGNVPPPDGEPGKTADNQTPDSTSPTQTQPMPPTPKTDDPPSPMPMPPMPMPDNPSTTPQMPPMPMPKPPMPAPTEIEDEVPPLLEKLPGRKDLLISKIFQTLKPAAATATAGLTLAMTDDGAIQASGAATGQAIYSIKTTTELKEISAIRLEILPASGGKTALKEKLALSSFTVTAAPLNDKAAATRLRFKAATADFLSKDFDLPGILTAKDAAKPAIADSSSKPAYLILQLDRPYAAPEGAELVFRIVQHLPEVKAAPIARLRLSASGETEFVAAIESMQKQAAENAARPLPEPTDAAWKRLEPLSGGLAAENGSQLRVEGDSIVASGEPVPGNDTYTIQTKPDLSRIGAFRLEVVSTKGVQTKMPGRRGPFYLTTFKIRVTPPGGKDEAFDVKLKKSKASIEHPIGVLSRALDDNDTTGWVVSHDMDYKNIDAVFMPAEPVDIPAGSQIAFILEHKHPPPQNQTLLIRQFRLYAMGEVKPPSAEPGAEPGGNGYEKFVVGAKKDMSDVNGKVWSASQAYKKGSFGSVGGDYVLQAAKASSPPLLSTINGLKAYRFDVPPGKYLVEVTFCETRPGAKPGSRVFSVSVEGRSLLEDFDIVKDQGLNNPLTESIEVQVTDGTLDIDFKATRGAAFLSAVHVKSIP